MKRLNPKTNLPFKHGDTREDGYIFIGYALTKLKKDGFFEEAWIDLNNFKKRNESQKKYQLKIKEKIKERNKKYRIKNFEKIKSIKKEWFNKNRELVYSNNAKRKATKLNATPSWLTDNHKKQIIEIYKNCIEITKQTGVQHHVDHIIPLKGKEVCGLHVPWNLQIITATENISKNNKLIEH